MSNKILYQPTPEKIAKTKMWQFLTSIFEDGSRGQAAGRRSLPNQVAEFFSESYQDLYQWSITYPEQFWQEIVKLADIKFSHRPHSILTKPENMEQSTWFEGATLNFAEHLL